MKKPLYLSLAIIFALLTILPLVQLMILHGIRFSHIRETITIPLLILPFYNIFFGIRYKPGEISSSKLLKDNNYTNDNNNIILDDEQTLDSTEQGLLSNFPELIQLITSVYYLSFSIYIIFDLLTRAMLSWDRHAIIWGSLLLGIINLIHLFRGRKISILGKPKEILK
ncbi:MAG: hypothetical protein MK212_13620 [Saprospiraceae bacterium]|nr:hypothetical protein [Saprospiraceae bacterium]